MNCNGLTPEQQEMIMKKHENMCDAYCSLLKAATNFIKSKTEIALSVDFAGSEPSKEVIYDHQGRDVSKCKKQDLGKASYEAGAKELRQGGNNKIKRLITENDIDTSDYPSKDQQLKKIMNDAGLVIYAVGCRPLIDKLISDFNSDVKKDKRLLGSLLEMTTILNEKLSDSMKDLD